MDTVTQVAVTPKQPRTTRRDKQGPPATITAPRLRYDYFALLGLEQMGTFDLIKRVNHGLPFKTFEELRGQLNLGANELAELILIPPRTLTRRRQQKRFTPVESDRLVRIARVLSHAIDLFNGRAESAQEWLARPQYAFGGITPLSLMRTEIGAREVDDLIGRIEHGVFS